MNDDTGDLSSLDEDDPFAKIVRKMADRVRDAFRGHGDVTRGQLLQEFRSIDRVAFFRNAIEETAGDGSGQAVETQREFWTGIYNRVAHEAGLAGADKDSYLGAFRSGFDMAARGEEGKAWEPPKGLVSEQASGLRAAFAGSAWEIERYLDTFYAEWRPRILKAQLKDYADQPDLFEVYKARLIQGFKVQAELARLDTSQAETFDRAVQKLFDADDDRITLYGDNPKALESCLGVLSARLREMFQGPPEELEKHLGSYRTFVRGFARFYLDMLPPNFSLGPDGFIKSVVEDRPSRRSDPEYHEMLEWDVVAECIRARIMFLARRLASMAELTVPQAKAFTQAIERAYDETTNEIMED